MALALSKLWISFRIFSPKWSYLNSMMPSMVIEVQMHSLHNLFLLLRGKFSLLIMTWTLLEKCANPYTTKWFCWDVSFTVNIINHIVLGLENLTSEIQHIHLQSIDHLTLFWHSALILTKSSYTPLFDILAFLLEYSLFTFFCFSLSQSFALQGLSSSWVVHG